MDYRPMLRFHQENEADLTVGVMNVPLEETDRFGIMTTDETGRIVEFTEKPKKRDKGTLASMGIYIFRAGLMRERLLEGAREHADLDFGKHVIPAVIGRDRTFAYSFGGYWVDVGTIQAYWEANLALLDADSPLKLYDREWTIHTPSYERPPAKIGSQARVVGSMICNGCIVRGQVERSVLSPGVYVSPGAVVRESVVMNDTWIGPGAVLDRVVIDKHVVVGSGAHVGAGEDLKTANKILGSVLDTGITVVGKSAHIPSNIRIGRNVLVSTDVDEEAFAAFLHDGVPSGETVGEGAAQ
jgi:glucose-1-phosphate adenylyltransferase